MLRLYAVIAVAFAIFWQSNCLSIQDGSIINKCGLWQKLNSQLIVISLKEEGVKEKNPLPIYNGGVGQTWTTSGTATSIAIGSSSTLTYSSGINTGNNSNAIYCSASGSTCSSTSGAITYYTAPSTVTISGMSVTTSDSYYNQYRR